MRIIVDNRSSLTDADAVRRVALHMDQPSQVDGRAYLLGALHKGSIFITHDENKRSHRFVVQDYREES